MSQFKIVKMTLGHENARNKDGDMERVNRVRWIAENPRFKEYANQDYYKEYPERLAQQRFITAVDARLWMGRSASASVVHCSVWLRNRAGVFSSGRGDAGGGGYHKESAALYEAFESAGVDFSKGWGGSGDQAMSRAVALVGAKLGFRAGGLI